MPDHDCTTNRSTSAFPAGTLDAPRRRQLLKGLMIPPVAAVAGCTLPGDDGPADPLVEDLEPGETTGYPGAMRFGERYAMTIRRAADGHETVRGRFDGADRILSFPAADGGNPVTTYLVDGDGYLQTADQCIAYPDLGGALDSVAAVNADSASAGLGEPELTVTDRVTRGARPMLVFERTHRGREEAQADVTYLVDDETRYPHRIETGTTVVEYGSWGEVGPIQPPAADCHRGR